MKWTFSIKNKLMASVVLLALCLLVLLSNYLDRKHTRMVTESISTLYEDRLIAEIYILDMTRAIYTIREISDSAQSDEMKSDAIGKQRKKLGHTYHAYSRTKLTEKEKRAAAELGNSLKKCMDALTAGNYVPSEHTLAVLGTLSELSQIQLEESKIIMKEVESQHATIKASSQFAFALVILILVVLQILVFSGESVIPVIRTKDPRLN